MKTTPEIRAMNGIELAVRRTAGRVRAHSPETSDALDILADEISHLVADAVQSINDVSSPLERNDD
jgi:hypothetical protein